MLCSAQLVQSVGVCPPCVHSSTTRMAAAVIGAPAIWISSSTHTSSPVGERPPHATLGSKTAPKQNDTCRGGSIVPCPPASRHPSTNMLSAGSKIGNQKRGALPTAGNDIDLPAHAWATEQDCAPNISEWTAHRWRSACSRSPPTTKTTSHRLGSSRMLATALRHADCASPLSGEPRSPWSGSGSADVGRVAISPVLWRLHAQCAVVACGEDPQV